MQPLVTKTFLPRRGLPVKLLALSSAPSIEAPEINHKAVIEQAKRKPVAALIRLTLINAFTILV
jgi:hypothetical protein